MKHCKSVLVVRQLAKVLFDAGIEKTSIFRLMMIDAVHVFFPFNSVMGA